MSVEHLRQRVIEGPIVRTLFWLAWPIVLASLVNVSYGLVDAFWLGKLGKEVFGAPIVSWPLISMFYAVIYGINSASTAMISQAVGAKDFDRARKFMGQLISFHILFALFTALVGVMLTPLLFSLIGIPSDVYPYAVLYLQTIFLGMPVTAVGFAFITIAHAIGETRIPTTLSISSALLNMLLDPILIFGLLGFPRLGVVGAAIATIVSRSLITFAGLYLLFVHGLRGLKICPKFLKIELEWLRKAFRIGLPMMLQQLTTSLGFVVMTSIVSRFGSAAVAAYGISVRILDLLNPLVFGLSRATAIMVGQNIGAEKFSRARDIALKASMILLVALFIGAATIFLLKQELIRFFVAEQDVVLEGTKLLSVFSWSIPFFAIYSLAGGVASGSGQTKFYAFVSIVRLWLLRVGLSILLGFVFSMGSQGVWIAMTISNIVAGAISMMWICRGTWLRKVV